MQYSTGCCLIATMWRISLAHYVQKVRYFAVHKQESIGRHIIVEGDNIIKN